MSRPRLSFRGTEITVSGRSWRVDFPVQDARLIRHAVVVLYDYSSGPRYQFANLEAFDLEGQKLWTAETPTTESSEAYVSIESADPLVVTSFTAFRWTIDPETGKILEREFTK